jgi:hypothetical protein
MTAETVLPKRFLPALPLVPVLALGIAGCDNGTTDPVELLPVGTGEVAITGDVSRSYPALAFFGSVPDEETDLILHLVLVIPENEEFDELIVLAQATDDPSFPEGDFSLLELDVELEEGEQPDLDQVERFIGGFGFVSVLFGPDASDEFLISRSGSISTSATEQGVSGSVQGQLVGASFDAETQEPHEISASVELTFHAEPAPPASFGGGR